MAFKFKGSLSAVDASLKGGVIFDNEKLSDSKIMPKGKFTINEIDESTTDLASNTLVTNFGKQDNIAGMFSFNTGDWKDTDSAPVKLMMRVVNDVNDSDWVTIFDSSKTTVTWSSIAFAGQTQFTVPNLDFKKAIIYVNGVLQYPGLSYQTFGGTVTFNSKLSTGDTIYVVVGEDTTNTDNEEYITTATEDQTAIVLPFTKKTNFVFINGILQYPNSYTVSGSTITLGDKLYLNDDILVLGNETDLVSFTALASQDQTDFTLPGEFDDGLVYINGVLQYDNAYSVSGTTLSFISSLDENDNVFVTLNDPKFIDSVNASYTSTITDESNNKLNIPYFNFSELQVFINGVLQNPDSGAYILNGTEITLSSPLQLGDDIHVIVYNSPVQNSNLVTKADLTSYATAEELQELKNSLKNEGINLKWQPHLPSIEVAFGLPRRSLKMWTVGSTSTVNQYWLYPVDGTVWTGTGTLGTVPGVPFYKLDSNKDVITWTYTATSDNVTRIFVPYNFGSITIFINGILQSVNLNHYTIDGQYVNLNGALQTGDNFIAILGKLVFNTNPYLTIAESSNIFINKTELKSNTGANMVGSANGTVQNDLIDYYNYKTDLSSNDENKGASLIGLKYSGVVSDAFSEIYVDSLGKFNNAEDGCTEAIIERITLITGMADSKYVIGQNSFIRVIFGRGTYKIKDLPLYSGVFYEGQSGYATKLIPHASASWIFTTIGTKPFDLNGVRVWERLMYFGIENLIIGDYWADENDVPSGIGGIQLKFASYGYLRNVRFRRIKACAIYGDELFDTTFDNISIMYCGNNSENTPCMKFDNIGSDDATNACYFNRLHLEANYVGMTLNKCRHLNFNFPKFERDDTSHLLEGCQGVTFTTPEMTWNSTTSPQFDIYPVSGSDSWGVKFIAPVMISSSGSGWYFRHTGTAGPLELLSPSARGISKLFHGGYCDILGGDFYDCGKNLIYATSNVNVDNVVWRALKPVTVSDGTEDAIIITGSNCSVRNCYFSSQPGSITDSGAFINTLSSTDTTITGNTFGGYRQYGFKAALSQRIRDNKIDISNNHIGTLSTQSTTYNTLVNNNINGLGVGSINSGVYSNIAVNGTVSPNTVVGCSMYLVRVIVNGAASSGVILVDSSNNTLVSFGITNTSLLSFTTGTAGDGMVHITKTTTGNSITITNYTSYTATVVLMNINGHG